LTAINSSPWGLGDFRGYRHSQSAPGWDIPGAEIGFLAVEGDMEMGYVSFGTFTVTASEAWITLKKGLNASYNVPEGIEEDLGGEMTGGGDDLTAVFHSLYGVVVIEVSANAGASRQGTVTITHPDSGDADLPAGSDVITVKQASDALDVDPVEMIFAGIDEAQLPLYVDPVAQDITITFPGANNVVIDKIDTGDGVDWFGISPESLAGTGDCTVSPDAWTGTSPDSRSAIVRVRHYEGGAQINLLDTVTVNIVQHKYLIPE
jgi:hypothetical protein